MKRKKLTCGNEGFTIFEIIVVLLILGILMAIAVPKYVDLMELSKGMVAQSQVAEIKSELNLTWGKTMLLNDGEVWSVTPLLSSLGYVSGVDSIIGSAPDNWRIKLTGTGTSVEIVVNDRGGDTGYNSSGTWNLPPKN